MIDEQARVLALFHFNLSLSLSLSYIILTGSTNVFYNGRCVTIESMHGGIEPSIIAAKLENTDIAVRVADLRKQYEGRYVFVGIDKVCTFSAVRWSDLR